MQDYKLKVKKYKAIKFSKETENDLYTLLKSIRNFELEKSKEGVILWIDNEEMRFNYGDVIVIDGDTITPYTEQDFNNLFELA